MFHFRSGCVQNLLISPHEGGAGDETDDVLGVAGEGDGQAAEVVGGELVEHGGEVVGGAQDRHAEADDFVDQKEWHGFAVDQGAVDVFVGEHADVVVLFVHDHHVGDVGVD